MLLLCAAIGPATAQEDTAFWSASCSLGETRFSIDFESASGDAFEDDMTVWLHSPAGQQVQLPIEPGLFLPRAALANVDSRCDHVAALAVGEGRLMVLLSRNGRPGWDWLDLALLDMTRFEVLDVRTMVGEIKTRDDVFVLRAVDAGAFDVRLIRETIADAGCDCEAAAIEDWMRIDVDTDHVALWWVDR